MLDYGMSLDGKTTDQLSEEITRINERMFKTNPSSPIYKQLLSMRDQAEMAYRDSIVRQQSKNLDDKPLNIGYAESTETELNMKEDELFLAVVYSYTKEPESKE